MSCMPMMRELQLIVYRCVIIDLWRNLAQTKIKMAENDSDRTKMTNERVTIWICELAFFYAKTEFRAKFKKYAVPIE